MKKNKEEASILLELDEYPLVSGQPTLEGRLLTDLDLKFDDIPSEPELFSKDVTCVRFDPMNRLYCISVDTEHEWHSRGLVSMLNAHSFGVPLIVSFNIQDKRQEIKQFPTARPVFHCPRCYLLWEINGKLPLVCNEPAQLFKGPATSLNTNDAFLLIDVLNWKKKFVTTELKSAFPLLRKATSSLEKNLIFKSVARRKLSRKKDQKRIQKEFYGMTIEEAIHMANSILIPCIRNLVPPIESEVHRYMEEFEGSIQIVGMKGDDGSFYPGFFSIPIPSFCKPIRKSESKIDSSTGPLYDSFHDFDFVARCKYTADGQIKPFVKTDFVHSDLKERFPSLLAAAASQIRKKCSAALKSLENKSVNLSMPLFKFRFCMKEGFELELSKVFASGIWFVDGEQQYVFPGLFDRSKQFIAAYCITKEGYLIPGCTGERQKFFPFAKYGANEHKPIKIHKCNKNLNKEKIEILENLKKLPKFPNSSDITQTTNWFCFKDKSLINDPTQITVPYDHLHLTNDNLNVYVGCEKGPDERLYLYGHYDDKDEFFPGAPALDSDQEFSLLPNFQSEADPYGNFAKRYGICFHEQSFLDKQQFGPVDNVSSDVRTTSVSCKNLEIYDEKLTTPMSSMDDAAWFAYKQTTRLEKEESFRGRPKVAIKVRRNERSDSQSLERTIVSEHSSLFEGSDRGSPGSKGMSWFNPYQKKLYEHLSMSEEEYAPESDLERRSSMSSPLYKIRPRSKGVLRSKYLKDPDDVDSMEETQADAGGEHKAKVKCGIDLGKLNPSGMPPPLSIPHRYQARTSTMAPEKRRAGGKKLPQITDDRGIGMVGGVGLVTKGNQQGKEIPQTIFRKPTETNRFEGLAKRVDVAERIVAEKAIEEKRTVSPQPMPEKTATAPEIFKLPETRTRKKQSKSQRRLKKQERISTIAKQEIPSDDSNEKGEAIKESTEKVEKTLTAEVMKERLQTLGNFKAIPDGGKVETETTKEPKEVDNAKRLARLLFRKERKSTFESDFLPDISDFSNLNFTQSFRFSYFTMPEHVKTFNKQVKTGSLKLPAISNQKSKAKKKESMKEKMTYDEPMHFI